MACDTLEKAYALMEQYLRSICHPVVFELGVCDGYHTNMLLGWCDEPTYFGFEPDPRNVQKLRRNGIARRILFQEAAVGHVTGPVDFHLATPDPSGHGFGASSISAFTPVLTQEWPWLKEQENIRVPCFRLDDFCRLGGLDHIDFLWMDVQGAERLVFEGGQNMIPRTGLIWTEYDGGTLYADSSTLPDILKWFPGWDVLADCGGDVLLWNPAYIRNRDRLTPDHRPEIQKP